MDWHFKLKQRASSKGAVPPSRRWLHSIDDWVSHVPAFEAEEDKPQPSAFDAPTTVAAPAAAPADETAAAAAPALGSQVLRAPPDCDRVVCLHCGEAIEMFWDADDEEWLLRDAVHTTGGRICHASCAV